VILPELATNKRTTTEFVKTVCLRVELDEAEEEKAVERHIESDYTRTSLVDVERYVTKDYIDCFTEEVVDSDQLRACIHTAYKFIQGDKKFQEDITARYNKQIDFIKRSKKKSSNAQAVENPAPVNGELHQDVLTNMARTLGYWMYLCYNAKKLNIAKHAFTTVKRSCNRDARLKNMQNK